MLFGTFEISIEENSQTFAFSEGKQLARDLLFLDQKECATHVSLLFIVSIVEVSVSQKPVNFLLICVCIFDMYCFWLSRLLIVLLLTIILAIFL